jgi:acetyl-CoA acetyltransferase
MKDLKTNKEETLVVAEDEGIRVSTMEQLAKLRTPFKKNGTVTAGSAS